MSPLATVTSTLGPLNGATTVAVGWTTVNDALFAVLCIAVSAHAPAGNATSIFPSGNVPLR